VHTGVRCLVVQPQKFLVSRLSHRTGNVQTSRLPSV
jgi:hypothetical protein